MKKFLAAMEPVAFAIFTENGLIRMWSPANEEVDLLADQKGLVVTPLYAIPQWHDMETAPRDRRILVKSPSGKIYVAHWVQHPETSDEAYCISEGPDGMQHLVYPVMWRELFA